MAEAQVRARRQRATLVSPALPEPAPRGRGRLLAGTALAALVSWGLLSFAAPVTAQVTGVSGGVVVGGQATIANTLPGQVTVTQTTNRGVIDWRSFSIGAGERVDFVQPGASSVTLNRVTGPDPSVIAGRLSATGQLILVNGAGIVFANGAQINAAGLVASTAGIADPQRFMQGGTVVFDQPSSDPHAGVVNAGTITVRDGGLVGLAGNTASNSGVINARLGRVTIGGTETFTVDLAGDGLINFQLGDPVSRQPLDAQGNKRPLVSNTGTINADGGTVTLTARAARGVVDNVVNAGGAINARAVREEGGVVVFGADDGGTVNVTGTVDVSAAAPGQRGGRVVATADKGKVNVASTAKIDASGPDGGGTVLIGGGKQGQGPVANARDVTVADGATIRADATGKGSGGTVIVWADNATVFGGLASARGGPQGGDGGLIETSGKASITVQPSASINASSVAGNPGTWLLDPTNLTIDATLAGQIVTQLVGGTSVLTVTVADTGGAGNITLGADVATTLITADVTWTVRAHGKIDLGNKTISLLSVTGANPTLVLDTVTLTSAAGDRSISGTGAITTTTLSLNSGGSVSLTGKVVATILDFKAAGAVTINDNSNDILNIAATASTAGGAVTIVSTEATIVQTGGIDAGANAISITTTGNGDTLTVNGALVGSTITLSSGDTLSGSSAITATGAVSLKAANDGNISLAGTIAGSSLSVESGSGGVTLSSADNAFGSFSTIGAIGGSVGVTHKTGLIVNATNAGSQAVAFTTGSGSLTLSGALTGSTITLTSGADLSGAGAITATGAVSLKAAGSGGISLTGTIAGSGLTVETAAGGVTLSSADNAFASFSTVGTIGGSVSVTHKTDLTVNTTDAGTKSASFTTGSGSITLAGAVTGSTITLSSGGGLSGDGAITATGAVSLKAAGSAGISLTGTIAGSGLTVETAAGGVTLSSTDNAFASFSTVGTIGGNVSVTHKTELTVNATNAGSNFAVFTTSDGNGITLAGALVAGGGVTLGASGKLSINAPITATGAVVALGGTSISQTSAGVITAGSLAAAASSGDIDLTQATSAVTTFVANATSGNIGFRELDGFAIGSVGTVLGITTTGNVQLSAGGPITQTEVVSASGLAVTATGLVDLTTKTNVIATFAANVTGAGVGLLVSDGLAVGSVNAIGALATVNGITTTGATSAVSLGAGGSITQTAAITAAGGLAAVTTSGDISLGSIDNATDAVAFTAPGNVSYRTTTNLTVSEVTAVGALASVSGIAATAGTTTLFANGLTAAIAQAKAISTATLDIRTSGSGTVTLTDSGNLIGSVQSTGGLGSGAVAVTDSAGGLNAGAITAGGPLTLTTTGGALVIVGGLNTSAAGKDITLASTDNAVTIGAAVNAGAGTVALKAGGADSSITATGGAITAGILTLETGASGGADIQTAAHSVGTVQTAGAGLGSGGLTFKQDRSGGLSVGAIVSSGAVSISEGTGALTLTGLLDTSAGNANVTLAANGNLLAINNRITAGSGQVALVALKAITQAASGAGIQAGSLRAVNTNGDISLASTGITAGDSNAVITFAASAGSGNVSYTSAGTFNVGTVDTTAGITTPSTRSVTLTVTEGGKTITQSAGTAGTITTGTINITTSDGNVTIDNDTNNIGALGTIALGSGSFTFVNNAGTGLDVGGNITANGGIDITNKGSIATNADITSDGAIALTSTAGQVILNGAVTSNKQSITLHSSGALDTGAGLVQAKTAATGNVTLISDTDTVTVGTGGVIVGNTFTVQIGPGLTLTLSGEIEAPSVTLVADQMVIAAAIKATDTITLAPVTAGTAVTLGNSSSPAGLVIDNFELGFLSTAATLTIGKDAFGATTAGTIRIGSATIASPTLNLFTTAGITQDTGALTVGGATGTLNITAGGTVNLNSTGIAVGTIGGSTTSGDFIVNSGGSGGDLVVSGITTAGGQIIVRNFAGDLTISGALTSAGGAIAIGSNTGISALNVNTDIDAGTGTVVLFAASGGIAQGGGKIVAANLLAEIEGVSGGITLASTTNQVTGNVTINAGSGSGNISFRNTVGYTVGGLASVATAVGTFIAPRGSGLRTGIGSSVTLTLGGDVGQATGASDIISTGTLTIARAAGTDPTVTFSNASNSIALLGGVDIGKGTFSLSSTGSLAIGNSHKAGGGYTVSTAGTLSLSIGASIDTSASTSGAALDGTLTLTATGSPGTIALNGTLNAGGGSVLLSAAGGVSQSVFGTIVAASVDARSASGAVTLSTAANAFGTITGKTAGTFSATTAQALTVGTGGVESTGGSVSLSATGAGNDVTVSNAVSASVGIDLTAGRDVILDGTATATTGGITLRAGRDVTLNSMAMASAGTVTLDAGGNIADTATGGVSASALRALATNGSVDLSAGTANKVSTIAGLANGDFTYVDSTSTAVTIGTVTTVGITSTTGQVSVKASAGTLGVTSAVMASAGDVVLRSDGSLNVSAGVSAGSASGRVTLTSATGSIVEFAGGTVAAAELLATAAVNVDLAQLNSIGTKGFAATATTGFVAFINQGAIELGEVGGTSGVTAGGAVVIANVGGDITQTAKGIITAGGGLLMQSGGSITLDQANLISGNFAVVATTAGDITIRNTGGITIGTVGPVATTGGINAFSGIVGGTSRILSLTSDTGTITQNGGIDDRIVTGELRLQTSNKNVTLTNAGNQLEAVGSSNLGSGTLTVFDSTGGLTLSSPVIADGGVILTTQGAFTLPGSIVVANGDISLTSLTGGMDLGSVLSAVNGQVQLDAGGVGTITQSGGTITARSLIVRAPGNVSLTQAANDVGTIAGASGAGSFVYRDSTAVSVGTLTSSTGGTVSGITTVNNNITIVAGTAGGSGGIAIDAPIGAGAGTLRLQTAEGSIVQAPGASITAAIVLANALHGSVDFGDTANAISSVAGAALGSTWELVTTGPLVITTIAGDGLTAGAAGIVVNNGDITLVSGGAITLNGVVNAANGSPTGGGAAGNITMVATAGSITQLATSAVVGNHLVALATGGVDLPSASNHVTVLAGSAAGGSFRFRNAGALEIDVVGGVSGVTANNQDIAIHAAGDLTLTRAVDARGSAGATTAVVRLQATGGNLTQSDAGIIVAGTLLANTIGSGSVVLTNRGNAVQNDALVGSPGLVAGTTPGNFRFVNGGSVTVDGIAIAGDPGLGIVGATGVTAGTGRLLDLGVAGGNLSIQGPVTANAGMILYRRVAGAPAGNITVGGSAGNAGNGTGGAYLLVVDLTGSSSVILTGLPESGAGSLAAPSGLFTTPTPPTTATPPGLGGPNAGGIMTIGGILGIDSTIYLSGGSASSITSTAPGNFGILGVYAQEGAQVNLQSIVRAISNVSIRPIGPFGPGDPGPVGGPPDTVARDYVRKGGLPSLNQRFNNCVIAGPSCTTIFTQAATPPAAAEEPLIGIAGSSLDDSSIILVNQGNEEFIEDDDERRRRTVGQK